MKFRPNTLLLIFVALLSCDVAFSSPSPPAPAPSALPPPVGLPIDNGIWVLVVISILIAFYKLSKIKKTSV